MYVGRWIGTDRELSHLIWLAFCDESRRLSFQVSECKLKFKDYRRSKLRISLAFSNHIGKVEGP
jgi:hypothetical protein